VLSGFKMACLEYTPGPVSFAKKTYARVELLDLRDKLLGQAQDGLKHGPVPLAQGDPFEHKELVNPRPFQVAGSEAASQRDVESRSSTASSALGGPSALPPLTRRASVTA